MALIETPKTTTITLNTEQLFAELEKIQSLQQRMTEEAVHQLFYQLTRQIPYAAKIIGGALAESVLFDAPHPAADLTLNHALYSLGQLLLQPSAAQDNRLAIQTYLHQRKTTEKAYAKSVLAALALEPLLKTFPENMHSTLQQLALFILEKVISEKQARKMARYIPEALTTITFPIIYQKFSALEQIKYSHHELFRKYINFVAQGGYELVIDQAKLLFILQEKQDAFGSLLTYLNSHCPNAEQATQNRSLFQFLQRDAQAKMTALNELFGRALPAATPHSILGALFVQLRARFGERLCQLLWDTDQNLDIYVQQQAISIAHDTAFSMIRVELTAVASLLTSVIQSATEFKRSWLRAWIQRKNLRAIEAAVVTGLLGAAEKQPLPAQKPVNPTGYPQQHLAGLYTNVAHLLANRALLFKGIFATPLKQYVKEMIARIKTESEKLPNSVLTLSTSHLEIRDNNQTA